jgi:putative spermidine/putrescine transport system permease protein
MIPRGKAYIALCAWTVLVSIFVLAPLLVTIAVSFTATEYVGLPHGGLSLRWYRDFFGRPDFLSAFRNSLVLALQSTALAVLLGTPVAIALTRYRFPGRTAVNVIASSPLFIPLVMSGLAILIFFATFNLGGPAVRLLVAHIAITVPYIIRMVSTSMAGFDWNQEVAARNLGASPLRAFIEIILPQVMPGVVAGALFALIVSFDDVGISIFLIGASYTTLPVELYAFAAYDMTPMVTAAAVVMIAFSAVSVMLIEWLFGVQRMLSGGGTAETPRPAAAS